MEKRFYFRYTDQGLVANVCESLKFGDRVILVNGFDTFYGCSWFSDLQKVFGDCFRFKIIEMRYDRGYDVEFPHEVEIFRI